MKKAVECEYKVSSKASSHIAVMSVARINPDVDKDLAAEEDEPDCGLLPGTSLLQAMLT